MKSFLQKHRNVWEYAIILAIIIAICSMGGCESPENTSAQPTAALPAFTLENSEYPSWSVFSVAAKAGLVNKEHGRPYGPLEEKWGVDIAIHTPDYDTCLSHLGSGATDAACVTNIDALKISLSRPCTMIMPTSTSKGADKVILSGVPKELLVDGKLKNVVGVLKKRKTYGLSKAVSEYVWFRGLEKYGQDPRQFTFSHLDPGAASVAFEQGRAEVNSICVWNPFALQARRARPDSIVAYDSTVCPEEVTDGVVAGSEVLKKPGGKNFACLILDIFYTIDNKLKDPSTSYETFAALGEDFLKKGSKDDLVRDMKLCCEETAFYTRDTGSKLFASDRYAKVIMPTVVKTAKAIGILEGQEPTLGFQDPNSQLNFTTEYMDELAKKNEPPSTSFVTESGGDQ